jgi:hypothetical protein
MPLVAPWDLVTAPTIADTTQWWALSALPAFPYDIANIQPLQIIRVNVIQSYSVPLIPDPGGVAIRNFNIILNSPLSTFTDQDIVAAIALVDTSSPPNLIFAMALPLPQPLAGQNQTVDIDGQLIAVKA